MSSLIPKHLPRTLLRASANLSPLRTISSHTQRTLTAGFSTQTPVPKPTSAQFPQRTSIRPLSPPQSSHFRKRNYATATPADAIIEDLTEQYGVARDEFEIASEETDKHSVYAEADRAAAVEELQKLKDMYDAAIEGEYGEEIKRRVGSRVRELEQGVRALEERALEDH
ncbi:uncharacterized protein EAF01_006480 [Botrytis porri]|uniref:Uncharacterized protein n=1 Tax=Botrytis porri TaxID=87229 RepID=A0A4Z1KTX5_9HELO|nr:uncharacterized protein EAF01_006480 [Botrytis porri]KAF7903431.1 hypothetical protein EAF01_006480 [Botrytis porri]TGO87963.1 hypothetical protein BPOR_0193g00140 [Botrytis porri]